MNNSTIIKLVCLFVVIGFISTIILIVLFSVGVIPTSGKSGKTNSTDKRTVKFLSDNQMPSVSPIKTATESQGPRMASVIDVAGTSTIATVSDAPAKEVIGDGVRIEMPQKEPYVTSGKHPEAKPKECCMAMTLECLACKEGISESKFCELYPTFEECASTKPIGFKPIGFNPIGFKPIGVKPICCKARTVECQAGCENMTEVEYCQKIQQVGGSFPGCENWL